MDYMNRDKFALTRALKSAFKILDTDGNGFIDSKELKNAIGEQDGGDQWKELMA